MRQLRQEKFPTFLLLLIQQERILAVLRYVLDPRGVRFLETYSMVLMDTMPLPLTMAHIQQVLSFANLGSYSRVGPV